MYCRLGSAISGALQSAEEWIDQAARSARDIELHEPAARKPPHARHEKEDVSLC